MKKTSTTEFDFLIIGAGLSGISTAYYLKKYFPHKTYAILEARNALGGTWDLFRYPGIRTDSDRYTYGYSFKPWKSSRPMVDGRSILNYIKEAAEENNIQKNILFNHQVKQARWSSKTAQWTLGIDGNPNHRLSCRFLIVSAGYYCYKNGYTPKFPHIDNFKGKVIHPQKWPDDLNYQDKNIIVIGSGATAITLVPALSKKAKFVTLLQRSPSYILSRPNKDNMAYFLFKCLPKKTAYHLIRWKKTAFVSLIYSLSRQFPKLMRFILNKQTMKHFGKTLDNNPNFNPNHALFDERLCITVDGEFFDAIRNKKTSIVTDQISHFTKEGVQLKSGKILQADIIVTATGLNMIPLGGIKISVDGVEQDISKKLSLKGVLLEGIPNMAHVFGYHNSISWTLRVDLINRYICRLINYMKKHRYLYFIPKNNDQAIKKRPFVDLKSGYVRRAISLFFLQGSRSPWKLSKSYFYDYLNLRFSSFKNEEMCFYRGLKPNGTKSYFKEV